MRRIAARKQAAVVVAQGDDASARQGGDIDHGCRLEAFGVGQRVAQHQTAFGVGIEHFDGQSVHRGDDVARLGGAARWHVFARGDDADDVQLQVHFADGAEGAQYRGGAAHVVLHFIHARTGLDRNAARVEGDALANQDHWRILGFAAHVLQDDEFRRLFAAVGDGQEAAHFQRFELFAVQHFDFKLVIFGQLLGRVGQVGRVGDVGRQVAQLARQVGTVGDGDGLRQRAARSACRRRRQDDLAHARWRRIFFAFLRVAAVFAVVGGLHHATDCPIYVALFHFRQR